MESKHQFKAAMEQAKRRYKTARIVLGMISVAPEEAALPLWSGWQQIARAAGLVSSDSEGDVSAVLERAARPGGALAGISKSAIADLEWIETSAADPDPSQISSFPEESWLRAAENLGRAISLLRKWQRKHLASRSERILHRIAQVAGVVFGLAAAGLVALGIHIAAATPEEDEGLSATYFARPNFKGHPFERIEHRVNLEWSDKPPLKGLKEKAFSIRFEGCLVVEPDSPRALAAGSDSPVRVYLNDEPVIENNSPSGYELLWADESVEPGIHKLKIEYPDCKVPGKLVLGWAQRADQKPKRVPAGNLVPLGGNRSCSCPASKSTAASSRGNER